MIFPFSDLPPSTCTFQTRFPERTVCAGLRQVNSEPDAQGAVWSHYFERRSARFVTVAPDLTRRLSHTDGVSTLYDERTGKGPVIRAANAGKERHGRRAGDRLRGVLVASVALALLAAGCGISLRAEQSESEIFQELTVESEAAPGATLSLVLEYQQPYPVEIDVICSLLEVPDEEQRERDRATAEAEAAQEAEATAELRVDEDEDDDIEKYLVFRILEGTLPANSQGGPLEEATPIADTIQRTFAAPDVPGEYVVLCYTPEDEDNALGQMIVVGPTPTAEP